MPVYNYSCSVCKKEWEGSNTIAERYNEFCCKKQANKIIAVPGSKVAEPVVYNYFCEGSGEYVTGRKQRDEMLKRRNLVPVG